MFEGVTNTDELIAAFQNFKRRKDGGGGSRQPQRRTERSPKTTFTGEKKCPNCGAEGHEKTACPKPQVSMSDRRCFICGEKNCRASTCPKKPKGSSGPVRAIEDGALNAITASALNGFFCVDHEGCQAVPSSRRPRTNVPSGGVTGAIGVLSAEALSETPGRPLQKGPRARVHGGVVEMPFRRI